jgi:hypothetical protein
MPPDARRDTDPADPRVARWLALSRVILGEAHDEANVLIHYRCVSRAHLAVSDQPTGRVTAHERRWAYCNDPNASADHEWEATGGVSVDLLRIEQRRLLEVLSQRRREVNAARRDSRAPEPAAPEPPADVPDESSEEEIGSARG